MHVPWTNKNAEFEAGRQNMMGFSCMKAVYEHTPYLHGREKYYYDTPHSGESAIRKSASQQSKYLIKKYGSSDPIRSLAVMRMARSFLARKKKKQF